MATLREGYRTARLWAVLVPLAGYLTVMWWAAGVTGVARVDGRAATAAGGTRVR